MINQETLKVKLFINEEYRRFSILPTINYEAFVKRIMDLSEIKKEELNNWQLFYIDEEKEMILFDSDLELKEAINHVLQNENPILRLVLKNEDPQIVETPRRKEKEKEEQEREREIIPIEPLFFTPILVSQIHQLVLLNQEDLIHLIQDRDFISWFKTVSDQILDQLYMLLNEGETRVAQLFKAVQELITCNGLEEITNQRFSHVVSNLLDSILHLRQVVGVKPLISFLKGMFSNTLSTLLMGWLSIPFNKKHMKQIKKFQKKGKRHFKKHHKRKKWEHKRGKKKLKKKMEDSFFLKSGPKWSRQQLETDQKMEKLALNNYNKTYTSNSDQDDLDEIQEQQQEQEQEQEQNNNSFRRFKKDQKRNKKEKKKKKKKSHKFKKNTHWKKKKNKAKWGKLKKDKKKKKFLKKIKKENYGHNIDTLMITNTNPNNKDTQKNEQEKIIQNEEKNNNNQSNSDYYNNETQLEKLDRKN
ncbi:chromatin assembly factor 1 subunit a caf-1 subunit a [Anaeramoeba flamelloides]|uniref:Chromatin assembly factor 1 subunit a caf-1 subunit a n=1 Tax=Anaeramoeba flamelloides TaxID=1746091 RepID=A0ABQ8YDK3_9EUKA|nr:chromatin assembly factor 1 subunit a caf-1 subunit a [Anaeramoeba flamelloides]